MKHLTQMNTARWQAILIAVSLIGCSTSSQPSAKDSATVGFATPSLCPTSAGLNTEKTFNMPLWDICVYRHDSNTDMSSGYFSLILSAEPGESPINTVSNPSTWNKLLGKVNSNIEAAVVTLRLGDHNTINTNPKVPVVALARATDGSSQPNSAIPLNLQTMPFTSLADGTKSWGVEFNYLYSLQNHNNVLGDVVSLGQKIMAQYPVGGVVGSLLPGVSSDERNRLNTFVSSLNSFSLSSAPSQFFYTAEQWGQIDHVTAVFYDKPQGEPDRRKVTTIILRPDRRVSVYTQKTVGNQPDFSQFKTGAAYGLPYDALGGSTRDVFAKSYPDLAAQLKTRDTQIFTQVCNEGPADFTTLKLDSSTDAILATWLALMNSPARITKGTEGMCLEDFLSAMRKLNLAPFPYQLAPNDTDPIQRAVNTAQTTSNMTKLSTALQSSSPNIEDHFAETVIVTQKSSVLPGVKVSTPQLLTAPQIAEGLRAINAQNLNSYNYTGVASSVAPAKLRVNGKNVPIQVEWSGVGAASKVTGLHIGDTQ